MEPDDLDHRHLRSALEFVVMIVAEASKRRPRPEFPAGLEKYARMQRLPAGALGPVRRIIESDETFRGRMGSVATDELVDPVGLLWLQRPEGWRARAAELVAEIEQEAAQADAEAALRREQKRREAAERAAARTRADLLARDDRISALSAEIEQSNAALAALETELQAVKAELVQRRTDLRHANDRLTAATTKLERAEQERRAAVDQMSTAESVRDDALADRTEIAAERAELAALAAHAAELSQRLAAAVGPTVAASAGEPAASRRALPLPGGVVGDTEAATDYLLRSGASVLVDGYNVAMLGWPQLELADQRRVLLDGVENLARRIGADLTVVFDGAAVVGAVADQRRLARVVFSPEGVIADDVIRAEVARLPPGRAVVVVTDDQAIIDDVRAMGANTVSSASFLSVVRR